jgi:hypothetical protein
MQLHANHRTCPSSRRLICRRVVDLPSKPQVIFTSTDLAMGRAFWIARDFVGSYDYGVGRPAQLSRTSSIAAERDGG